MKKLNHLFLLSMLTVAITGHAQVKAIKEVVDNVSYVSLDALTPLYNTVGWSEDKKFFTIQRKADNNEFKLNLVTGELTWNSQIIGIVPNSQKINTTNNLFPINVVETLTGTNAVMDKDSVIFNYDSKLQSNSWTLFINGELVSGNIKSVGNVLLLPIEAVANKLGSTVDFSPDTILYRRLQDNARIELNIHTGIIKVNDKIQGTVGNLFFIDPVQKVVPLNIVEILAGITIDLDSAKSRVNLSLDSRIANTSFGSKLIAKELKDTPFTLQSIGYDINSDGYTNLKADMYMSSYNGRINYQSGAGIWDKNGAKPSLLNFQWSSYDGSSGTIGDVNLGNRQLSGININRIKGIEYNNTTSDGNYNYSLTAGQIIQNNTEISLQQFNDIKNGKNTYIPLNYGGGAYGIRIYPKNKPYEFGLSYLNDPQLGRDWAVASFTYKSNFSDVNSWNYYLNVDAGQLKNKLSNNETKSGFDFKGSWTANRSFDKINVNLDGNYSGQLFEQYYQPTLQTLINNNNGIGNNPLSPLLPNIDNVGYSKFSQNTNISYKLNDTMSVSYGLNYNNRKNDSNTYDYLVNNFGFSKVFKQGSFSLNNLRGNGTDVNGDYRVNIINAIAQRNFAYVNVMGRVDYDSINKFTSGQLSTQLAPWKNEWKDFTGSLNTSLSYNFTKKKDQDNQSAFLNLNYALSNARPMDGWNFTGGIGASMKLYEKNSNSNFISGVGNSYTYNTKKVNPFVFANASYAMNKAFRFNVSASYDNYGKVRVFAGIMGDIDYAPPRIVSNYIPHKGVLRGKVFIDENYDGIQQPEEDKKVSVLVSIKGTSLSLNTNENGNFTIQNLNPGLYEIGVSVDNLPLGWELDDEAKTRFSIIEDNITEISLPIRRVYSVTGQAISQKSDNEGLTVEIYKGNEVVKKTLTTFGGQFSFDGLKPGSYTVKLYDNNEVPYSKEVVVRDGVYDKPIFNLK